MAIFMGVRHMLVPDTALCTAGSGANLEKMPTQQFTCLINYLLHRPTEKGKLYKRCWTEPEQGKLRKKQATPLTSLGQEKRRANFTEKKQIKIKTNFTQNKLLLSLVFIKQLPVKITCRWPLEAHSGQCENGADDGHILDVVDTFAQHWTEWPGEREPLGKLRCQKTTLNKWMNE